MQRIRQFLFSIFSHFQAKLLLAFLLCTLIPLGIISYISYYISYRIAEDKIVQSTLHMKEQIEVQMNERIAQAEALSDSLQYDMYSLTKSADGSISQYLTALTVVRNNISLYMATFDFSYISVYLPKEQLGSNEQLYFYSLEDMYTLLPASYETPESIGVNSQWFYIDDFQIPYIVNNRASSLQGFACMRMLNNQGSNQTDYAYLILLGKEEFTSLMQSSFADTTIKSYLLDENGSILAHANGNETEAEHMDDLTMELPLPDNDTPYTAGQNRYYTSVLDNGWYHITVIPEEYIKSNVDVLLRTILITLALSLPVTFFVVIMFSKNLTKRIRRLSGAMITFQEQKDEHFLHPIGIPHPKNPERYDEIDTLGITFENMQASLGENMKQIIELSLTEERLKYQLLQAQINPHFLYNILGSIQSCQISGKIETAEKMTAALARFYRLTLRNTGELISIKKELEISLLYLELEKLCHKNRLTWDITIEDGADNFLICKFTLQPFLENSILHGLSDTKAFLHITIDIRYGEDTVVITLSDNGVGIAASQLEKLTQTLNSDTARYDKHFGIGNVNQRIKSPSFGKGHVRIESQQNVGTTVTIEFNQM